MRRFPVHTLALALLATLAGCVVPHKPYEPPVDVPLQAPLPGMGVVYLLRVPHDRAALDLRLAGRAVAQLPPATYGVMQLPPGRYLLRTGHAGAWAGALEAAPPLDIEVAPGSRRFYAVSGTHAKAASLDLLPAVGRPGVQPVVTSGLGTEDGTRRWKEVTELDAQGLMSISTPVPALSGPAPLEPPGR